MAPPAGREQGCAKAAWDNKKKSKQKKADAAKRKEAREAAVARFAAQARAAPRHRTDRSTTGARRAGARRGSKPQSVRALQAAQALREERRLIVLLDAMRNDEGEDPPSELVAFVELARLADAFEPLRRRPQAYTTVGLRALRHVFADDHSDRMDELRDATPHAQENAASVGPVQDEAESGRPQPAEIAPVVARDDVAANGLRGDPHRLEHEQGELSMEEAQPPILEAVAPIQEQPRSLEDGGHARPQGPAHMLRPDPSPSPSVRVAARRKFARVVRFVRNLGEDRSPAT